MSGILRLPSLGIRVEYKGRVLMKKAADTDMGCESGTTATLLQLLHFTGIVATVAA